MGGVKVKAIHQNYNDVGGARGCNIKHAQYNSGISLFNGHNDLCKTAKASRTICNESPLENVSFSNPIDFNSEYTEPYYVILLTGNFASLVV